MRRTNLMKQSKWTVFGEIYTLASCLLVFSLAVACVTQPTKPLDAKAIGPSMRSEVADLDRYVVTIRDEILPRLDTALMVHPGEPMLIAIRDKLSELSKHADDSIGRGKIILLVLDEAERSKP